MGLSPGSHIGAYEIVGVLGAGGMGAVYRARDTILRRDVAIKVLPDHFSRDAERMSRFRREAQVLASLNHQNIATIYGFEHVEGLQVLVMELVQGGTLAERLIRTRGRGLPPAETIAIARQLIEALDAAHEKGVVHRDLKPSNIGMTPDGQAKVLDFGLARIDSQVSGNVHGDIRNAPTITIDATGEGVVLGTVPYMSPEQARGQVSDKRTDIWAFGCVLFEMLTGRPPFAGATQGDTLAAILERQPDWSNLPRDTPAGTSLLLHRCLEKDPRRRLRDIGDARDYLDDANETRHTRTPRLAGVERWLLIAILAAASLVAGIEIGRVGFTERAPAAKVSRLSLALSPAESLLGTNPLERSIYGRSRPTRRAVTVSPDGSAIVFSAVRNDRQQLWLRYLNQSEATPIAGTEQSAEPFFSPDGAWIGYWSAGALRKIRLSGGEAVKLCDSAPTYGASWSADDTIVFAQANAIWRVAAAGGTPEQLTKPLPGEARHLLPELLPGGKWLLFTLQPTANDWETATLVAQSLESGERKTLLTGVADARYIPTGHLAYVRFGDLFVVQFSVERLSVQGGEQKVATGVMQSINSTFPNALDTGAGQYAFSRSGTLAYALGGVLPDFDGALEWIDRAGNAMSIPLPAPPRPYFEPRLSVDGQHLILSTLGLREQNLWLYQFSTRTLTRLTSQGRAEQAVWSGDGQRIAFAMIEKGFQNVFVMAANGTGSPARLTEGSLPAFPNAWVGDGHAIIISQGGDLKLLDVASRTITPLQETRFNERMPVLSPDGRWLAYVSDETGRNEIYVQAFPEMGRKQLVSVEGGTNPAWSRDGRTLSFLAATTTATGRHLAVMQVQVSPGTSLTAGPARKLFDLDASHYSEAAASANYDVSADGARFVFVHETYSPPAPATQLQIVQNWFAELRGPVSPR